MCTYLVCERVRADRVNFIIFDEILKLVDKYLSFSIFVVSFAIPLPQLLYYNSSFFSLYVKQAWCWYYRRTILNQRTPY